jgi:hypothetical protein
MVKDRIAPEGLLASSEVTPMNVGRRMGMTLSRAATVVLTVGLIAILARGTAYAQHTAAGSGNALPNQPIANLNSNPYSAAYGVGKYTPFPVKDPTAAERAVVAGRVYWTIIEESARRAVQPAAPVAGPRGEHILFGSELAERLGQWSLRWEEAQDNAAKNLGGRYQALSDHLSRLSSLEDGRFPRAAVDRVGIPKGPAAGSKPPRLFAEIVRFFRLIGKGGIDRVVPDVVELERPLDAAGVGVTAAERARTAGSAFETVLHSAVEQFLSAARAGEARRDLAAIFDGSLAERLAIWSDLWMQAEKDAAPAASSRSTIARNGSARMALAGRAYVEPGPSLVGAALKSHIERLRALENGHILTDALKRDVRSGCAPLEMVQLGGFVAVTRFFRLEAERQLPELSRQPAADRAASSQAAAARQIYQAILDEAAHRYIALAGGGNPREDNRSVFDTRLAERLGAWSVRWGQAEAGASDAPGSRFAAVRSHLERMASLEDGPALRDAGHRASAHAVRDIPSPPGQFADVARFFRLHARWELELVRSR